MDWGSDLPKVRLISPFATTSLVSLPSCCRQPLLTAYELQVALGEVPWSEVYPMDYYSGTGGPWSNNVQTHVALHDK
jgi:hypothetical protein